MGHYPHEIRKTADLIPYAQNSRTHSGSTLIACEKTNRNAYLMELDPKYCDVIVNRWQDYTGEKAKLEATGQTYDELKAERLEAVA